MNRRTGTRPGYSSKGFSLLEVLFAMVILTIAIVPSIMTVQQTRIRARSVGLNLIGQNLAVAMTELVKRSGYDEIAYAQAMPDILDAGSIPNPLLDFPRSEGSPGGDQQSVIPAGPPGDASEGEIDSFLATLRSGEFDHESSLITSNTNYLFFSPDQIAALNGYESFDAVPDDLKERLLDPQYAWGLIVRDGDPDGDVGGGVVNTGLKHIVVIVKWIDVRRNRRDYTALETYVSEVAPRM